MANRQRRAFITGITGQDGSYLAEFLLEMGYLVAGLIRPNSTGHLGNIENIRERIKIYRGNLADAVSLETAIMDFDPDEVYNLGAEASPFDSFKRPVYTSDINALGPLRIYNACKRLYKRGHKVKIYQASTSELFGAPTQVPQNENTPFKPNNPYGVAKLFAHEQARILRTGSDNMFISTGILFNHESPRRGMQYVTRKITVGVACIKNRVKHTPLNEIGKPIINDDWKLEMGNLDAERDWGYAPDYVNAMYRMLQADEPGEYVIATGETHTIKDFLNEAFSYVDLNWQDHVVINPEFVRPLETGPLMGDASRAWEKLKWTPTIDFKDLVKTMVDADLARFS